jgi:hypothetical protein
LRDRGHVDLDELAERDTVGRSTIARRRLSESVSGDVGAPGPDVHASGADANPHPGVNIQGCDEGAKGGDLRRHDRG